MDIQHLSLERNIYGISINTKNFSFGLQKADEGIGIGGRYGFSGTYKTGKIYFDKHTKEKIRVGNVYIFGGTQFHDLVYYVTYIEEERQRSNLDYEIRRSCHKKISNSFSLIKLKFENNLRPENQKYNPWFIDISVGFYIGVRYGLNFTEMYDFGAGFFGYDPENDDIVTDETLGATFSTFRECLPEIQKKQGFCSIKNDKIICESFQPFAKCVLSKNETGYYLPEIYTLELAKEDCLNNKGKFSLVESREGIAE